MIFDATRQQPFSFWIFFVCDVKAAFLMMLQNNTREVSSSFDLTWVPQKYGFEEIVCCFLAKLVISVYCADS